MKKKNWGEYVIDVNIWYINRKFWNIYVCIVYVYSICVLYFIRKIIILEKEYICLIFMYFFLILEDEIY